MLVRVRAVGTGRRGVFWGIDRPAPCVTATGAEKGLAVQANGIDVLVEPWEDVDAVKLRAQRGGAMSQYDDVTERGMTTIVSAAPSHVQLEPDAFPSRRARADASKPPYHVPSMAEIADAKPNGRVAASTFSCAGGSCLGYRMAGFDVRAAVEIDAVPASSYRANFPGATVIEKSVRDVEPREILKAARVKKGELDLFDGSPPCTSFSTAGLRAKTWGKVREHAGTQQRVDDLFFEYARLVDGIQPRVFVAENVSGLARGAAIGYFKAILRVLRECGYVVAAQLLDADMLGVPQNRERVIFIGVRADVAKRVGLDVDGIHADVFPKPLPYQYTVRDALPWLDPSAQAFSLQGTPFGDPERIANGKATPPERVHDGNRPAATMTTQQGRAGVQVIHDTQGSFGSGPIDVLDQPVPTITVGQGGRNSEHFKVEAATEIESPDGAKWKLVETAEGGTVYRRRFTLLEVKRLCSFPDDFILEGRFAQQWAQLGNSVPPLMMRAVAEGIDRRVFDRLNRRASTPRRKA